MRTPPELEKFIVSTASANRGMSELILQVRKTRELHAEQLNQLISTLQKTRELLGEKDDDETYSLRKSRPITERVN
jgi:hypothetical protein